jgi:predicted nucleic acid-binding protein
MRRVYLDTNVFLYAVGAESRYKDPCREILRAVAAARLGGETSALTIQEIVHQRWRRGDVEATRRGRDVMSICSVVHPIDGSLSSAALRLVDEHPGLGTGDAFHAATALTHGMKALISADSDFDDLPGFDRVDPLDSARLAELARD